MWRIYMQHISDLQIGVRLQKLRESKGNNKTDLAIELNISTAQYGRLENGKATISIEVLNKICSYYNTSVNYILFGESNSYKSLFFDKINGYPQSIIRRILKILSCLFYLQDNKKYYNNPFYKIFIDGLLETIPVEAPSALMYVLEYERNRRKASENWMIRELGLTRFKWDTIMKDKSIHDIYIPLQVSNQYGYDMDFLINNKINADMFFDNLFAEENPERQKNIMQVFDLVVKDQEKEYHVEKQENNY